MDFSRPARVLSRASRSFSRRSTRICRSISADLAADDGLLERLRLLPILTRLAFGVGQELVGLLFRVEDELLFSGFPVPLGVPDDAKRLFLGAADRFSGNPFSIGDPNGEHGRSGDDRDSDINQVPDDRQHA